MFDLTWTEPCDIEGTIEVPRPIRSLGMVTDIHGQEWDIRGIYPTFVQATKRENLHSHFTATTGFTGYGYSSTAPDMGIVSQRWLPYHVKVTPNED